MVVGVYRWGAALPDGAECRARPQLPDGGAGAVIPAAAAGGQSPGDRFYRCPPGTVGKRQGSRSRCGHAIVSADRRDVRRIPGSQYRAAVLKNGGAVSRDILIRVSWELTKKFSGDSPIAGNLRFLGTMVKLFPVMRLSIGATDAVLRLCGITGRERPAAREVSREDGPTGLLGERGTVSPAGDL